MSLTLPTASPSSTILIAAIRSLLALARLRQGRFGVKTLMALRSRLAPREGLDVERLRRLRTTSASWHRCLIDIHDLERGGSPFRGRHCGPRLRSGTANNP